MRLSVDDLALLTYCLGVAPSPGMGLWTGTKQYVKVARVSDFHGHPTKGEQIADKGEPFPFSSVLINVPSAQASMVLHTF
ncbi:hypothetical protein NQZ68_004115 [Dissostichus eleginoides]|nr:hypothetical protein NQZ68_004115 [Dissostichus eleginoides]